MQTAYISIDMDFWENAKIADKAIRRFLKTIPKVPKIAVMNHQQLLRHVNSIPADVLVNIDTHSDFSDESGLDELNCGTWVNYVKWRRKAHYIWFHAQSRSYGNCNSGPSWDTGHGYLSAQESMRKEKVSFKELLFGLKVVGVGVCLSPAYIMDYDLEQVFRGIVKDHKIRYFKGDRSESVCRNARPPFGKKSTTETMLRPNSEMLKPGADTNRYVLELNKQLLLQNNA